MIRPSWLAPVLLTLLTTRVFGAGPELVEPADLGRRPELAGRDIVVDDRVRYFLETKRGQGYDEVLLKRTDIPFRLPTRLRPSRAPSEPNARIRGVLRFEEGRWFVAVATIEMLAPDSERLEGELNRLRPDDYQGRRNWAFWAERRGKELNDSKLEARGVALEAESFWAEASRPEADALALVERSAGRPIPGAVRGALAHRGLRLKLAQAATAAEFEDLAQKIEAILPGSAQAGATAGPLDPTLLVAYAREPGAAYREASDAARWALDRRLLADAIQKALEKEVEARPGDAARLAEAAATRLPDRPALADRLRQLGLGEAESRVASMRQAEVEELAKKFRDGGQEDRARRLLQAWLADRRKNRLSASDAEGRIYLAASFDKLIGDRASAADLLREALAIDPQSKAVVDAFLRMGFRKGDSGWFDPNNNNATTTTATPAAESGRPLAQPDRPTESGDSLRGLTRAQVRSRLGGKPDSIVRSATQSRCVEQWIYRNPKGNQVVVFLIDPGTVEPRASAYYSDPK